MPSLRQMIISDYQERVMTNPSIPSELKVSLKSHERVPVFVDNLVGEINRFPSKIKIDRVKLKSLVYDMTDVFVLGVKATAEDRYKSDLDKMIAKEKAKEQFELDNQGNGVVKDLGVEVKDG